MAGFRLVSVLATVLALAVLHPNSAYGDARDVRLEHVSSTAAGGTAFAAAPFGTKNGGPTSASFSAAAAPLPLPSIPGPNAHPGNAGEPLKAEKP